MLTYTEAEEAIYNVLSNVDQYTDEEVLSFLAEIVRSAAPTEEGEAQAA